MHWIDASNIAVTTSMSDFMLIGRRCTMREQAHDLVARKVCAFNSEVRVTLWIGGEWPYQALLASKFDVIDDPS